MGIDKVSLPSLPTTAPAPAASRSRITAAVLAAMAAGAAPCAWADIELGDGLSVSGFVDMSFVHYDEDGSPADKVFGIDQVETSFLYSGSAGVSAQVDIEYNDEEGTFVEQAFLTKAFTDQFSMKAGRFLSYSGWETEEPTGLFQYSGTGYGQYFYGYYQQGISASYDAGKVGFMASVVTSAFDPLERGASDLGYEVGVALKPLEGLTAKAFYIVNNYAGTSQKDELINAWLSYSVSGFTFAGEYNTADYADGGDGDGYLLMANYASGPWGVTLRYHNFEIEDALGVTAVKNNGFTLSPSYALGDNLLLVTEYRRDKWAGGVKSNAIALEALFTF